MLPSSISLHSVSILHHLLDINTNISQVLFLHSGYLEAEGPRFSQGLTSQVVFEMLPQSRGRREGFLAILTEKGFAARMYPRVILQTSQRPKTFTAARLSTLVRSLAGVSPHVNSQVGLTPVLGLTHPALVPRLGPGVQRAVGLQVLLGGEVLPTLQAEEWSLSGMSGVVNLEVTFLDK